MNKRLVKKLKEIAEKLCEIGSNSPDYPDPTETMGNFKAIERANLVNSPFGPSVTDWHYPMYPASLITNLQNAPYPYSQAYASRIIDEKTSRELEIYEKYQRRKAILLTSEIPDTLYCTIDKIDKERLPEDGIRVGTIFYENPKQLKPQDLVLKVRIPSKMKKRFWSEKGHFVSVAQVRSPYFKVIYER